MYNEKTRPTVDGILVSDEDRWKSYYAQVLAQFKDNVVGLSLKDVYLALFPICNAGNFYVVVFSLSKKPTMMTILDNSGSGVTYDEKYKEACDPLKKLFAHHVKWYGHTRHSSVSKVKARIPKLKWRTSRNDRDCGIFAMLHMESYMGQAVAKWETGLVAESKLQFDMLRRLRFKFATIFFYIS